MNKEELLTLVRTTGWDHSVSSYECDMCGEHYVCLTCAENLLSSDHAIDKIIELLDGELDD